MRTPGIIAFGIVTGLAVSFSASAQTYSVGVENIEYFPQYSFKDGEYRGFARVILDAFAKSKGYTFDYRPLPVARLFHSFVSGELDLKYPDNAYWSSDLKKSVTVVYSDPVVAYIDGVNVLPDRVGKQGETFKTLGIVRGFTAWDWMPQLEAGKVKQQENNSFTGLLEQTLAGRVDGAYANVAVVNYLLTHELKKTGGLVYDPSLSHTESNYHLSSIKHPKLIEEFNAWMKASAAQVEAMKAEYGVSSALK